MSTTETSEREAFEAWYTQDMIDSGFVNSTVDEVSELRQENHYGHRRVMLNGKWEGWQARSALASQPVTQSVEPVAKECRHCGWMCAPNNAPTRRWYPLAAPQPSVSQERQEGEAK